jgi:hypothetical protein
MWREPLDELIEDLERLVPDSRNAHRDLFPIEKLQQWTDTILYGSDDEVAALKRDPEHQRWIRHWAEIRGQPKTEPFSASGLASLDRTVLTGEIAAEDCRPGSN